MQVHSAVRSPQRPLARSWARRSRQSPATRSISVDSRRNPSFPQKPGPPTPRYSRSRGKPPGKAQRVPPAVGRVYYRKDVGRLVGGKGESPVAGNKDTRGKTVQGGGITVRLLMGIVDRKSTRLNSSHLG